MFWTKCGLALYRPLQPNQRKGEVWNPLAKLGKSPSKPTLHTLNFLRKWISVPLHPAATNADDLNCIRQLLRKTKLHSWSVQRPEHGHGMFPNSGIKEFHLNALNIFFPEIPSAKPSMEPL